MAPHLSFKTNARMMCSFIADLILVSLTHVLPSCKTNNKLNMQLYRCYMVWGRSKYVLVGAAFLVLGDTSKNYIY